MSSIIQLFFGRGGDKEVLIFMFYSILIANYFMANSFATENRHLATLNWAPHSLNGPNEFQLIFFLFQKIYRFSFGFVRQRFWNFRPALIVIISNFCPTTTTSNFGSTSKKSLSMSSTTINFADQTVFFYIHAVAERWAHHGSIVHVG